MTVPISGDPTISGVVLTEQASTPTSPSSGKRKLYVDASGVLKLVDSAGSAAAVGAASYVPLALVDAKGDLLAALGADTVVRLAVGTNGQVLTADGAEATGIKWATPSAGMSNPMTTAGDTIIGGTSGTPTRLAIGTAGHVLTVVSGAPAWQAAAAGGGGYATVQDEGTSLTARTTLNVVGPGAVADDSGSVTRLRVADPAVSVLWRDEFIGGNTASGSFGDMGWVLPVGGSSSFQAAEQNHPGIYRRTTSTTSGTSAFLYPRNSGSTGTVHSGDTFELVFIVRLNTNDANTAMRFGLTSNTASTAPAEAVQFEKAAADTSWFGGCRNASSESRSSAVAAVDTSWHRFRIRRVDGSTIGFSVDGGTEQTVTTNIPSASMQPFLVITNSAAADKTYDLDYVHVAVAVSR